MRRWGIDPAFDHRTFDIVTFDDSQLRAVVAHTPRPMFYLVHRGSGPGTLGAALTSDSAYTDMKPDQGPSSPPAPTEPTAWPPVHAHTSLPDPAHAIVHPLLAPGGYSYLLIWDGRGTMATALFGPAFVGQRQRWRTARDATVDTFQQLVPDLRLGDPQPFGGYGALLAPPRLVDAAGRWLCRRGGRNPGRRNGDSGS